MTERADPVVVAGRVFSQRFGDDAGKRLESILPQIGLELQTRNARSYEGCLLRIKGVPRGYIVVSSSIKEPGRRRFTLAHELGHYLLPDQQDLSSPCTIARENRLATLVGTTTAGEVLGGANFKLVGGYRLRMPVAGWYTWSGDCIEGKGVPPDVPVDVHPESLASGTDNQLNKAIEVAQTL